MFDTSFPHPPKSPESKSKENNVFMGLVELFGPNFRACIHSLGFIACFGSGTDLQHGFGFSKPSLSH